MLKANKFKDILILELNADVVYAAIFSYKGKKLVCRHSIELPTTNLVNSTLDLRLYLSKLKERFKKIPKNTIIVSSFAKLYTLNMSDRPFSMLTNEQITEAIKWEVEPFLEESVENFELGYCFANNPNDNVWVSVVGKKQIADYQSQLAEFHSNLVYVVPPEVCIAEASESQNNHNKIFINISNARTVWVHVQDNKPAKIGSYSHLLQGGDEYTLDPAYKSLTTDLNLLATKDTTVIVSGIFESDTTFMEKIQTALSEKFQSLRPSNIFDNLKGEFSLVIKAAKMLFYSHSAMPETILLGYTKKKRNPESLIPLAIVLAPILLFAFVLHGKINEEIKINNMKKGNVVLSEKVTEQQQTMILKAKLEEESRELDKKIQDLKSLQNLEKNNYIKLFESLAGVIAKTTREKYHEVNISSINISSIKYIEKDKATINGTALSVETIVLYCANLRELKWVEGIEITKAKKEPGQKVVSRAKENTTLVAALVELAFPIEFELTIKVTSN